MKICVWQRSNKDTFPLEITHVRGDECQREATRFKQNATVHEKFKKGLVFQRTLEACNKANFQLFLVPNTTSLMVWQFVNSPFSCVIVLSVNVNICGKQYWQGFSQRIEYSKQTLALRQASEESACFLLSNLPAFCDD